MKGKAVYNKDGEKVMEISEIKRRFYSPNTRFYGRMYGSTSVDDEIIEINKKEIRFAASRSEERRVGKEC